LHKKIIFKCVAEVLTLIICLYDSYCNHRLNLFVNFNARLLFKLRRTISLEWSELNVFSCAFSDFYILRVELNSYNLGYKVSNERFVLCTNVCDILNAIFKDFIALLFKIKKLTLTLQIR